LLLKMGLIKPIAICTTAGVWGKLSGLKFVEPAMKGQHSGSKMCVCEGLVSVPDVETLLY